MTDKAVEFSITIKMAEREMEFVGEIEAEHIEEGIQRISLATGMEAMKMSLQALDQRIAKQVPKDWQNVGTEERWLVSSIGAMRYKRRIYLDEKGKRRKPVDELLGIEKYGRMSGRVQEMGASLACMGTYRLAANQLSYLIKTPISHSAVQRMAWKTGNRIADGKKQSGEEFLNMVKQLKQAKSKHRYCMVRVMGFGYICSERNADRQK